MLPIWENQLHIYDGVINPYIISASIHVRPPASKEALAGRTVVVLVQVVGAGAEVGEEGEGEAEGAEGEEAGDQWQQRQRQGGHRGEQRGADGGAEEGAQGAQEGGPRQGEGRD